jgi:hypothetical protein
VRPIYRGRVCFRCWAGIKWTSIWQRVQNKNGNNPSYAGVPINFTKEGLIQWVMDNPPPKHLEEPSIDRIVDSLGYSPGNLQWLEKRQNSRAHLKYLPPDVQYCAKCKEAKPATTEFFNKSSGRSRGISSYCRPCNNAYKMAWHKRRELA